MPFTIPPSLKAEHAELHAKLVEATKVSGAIGESARAVAELLHPHFEKEEDYALPPLGLLAQLAEGKLTPEMGKVTAMTDKLRADLHRMLAEHQEIVPALEHLVKVATKEGQGEYADFSEKLMLHAKTEEEVLYPAAIVLGEYVKLKLSL